MLQIGLLGCRELAALVSHLVVMSRRVDTSLRTRLTTTSACTERVVSGVARVTAVGLGAEEAGRLSHWPVAHR